MRQDQWRICLLGRLQVQSDQTKLTHLAMRRAGALLSCLVMRAPHPVPREELLALLWPKEPSDTARNRLRVLLSSLRRSLVPTDAASACVLAIERHAVRLVSSAFTSDYHDFLEALRAARTADEIEAILLLEKAISLYQGELLVGFYDDWILIERRRMAEMRYQALRDLVQRLTQSGRPENAIEYARQAVAAEPMDEEAHCDLMRLYDTLGQSSAGLRQYEQLKRLLWDELQAQPSELTRQLATQIEANLGHGMTQTRRSVRPVALRLSEQEATIPLVPETLPLRLTRFFGREPEIDSLRTLLLPNGTQRLVTLLGLGGIGKTRLAIEAAEQLKGDYAGRVFYVSLAELSDPRLIPSAIVDALGIRRSPLMATLDQVVSVLTAQPSLLILDNVEHLLGNNLPISGLDEGDARAVVQTLLRRVSDLTCLLTSRQPLEVEGEVQFPVLPLPIPTEPRVRQGEFDQIEKHRFPADLLPSRQSPSVQMFVDRAQCVRPDFQLTPHNIGALVTLCARLEGFPLAIELAAAWAQTFTPAQMLSSLPSGRLLVSRRKDRPERHRSLRAAITWSFQLLTPELRRFFTRLSVFVGDWSLEAAAEICEEEAVEEALSELRARSMILAEEAGDAMRYRLLETLRQYAADQLHVDDREVLARRHALFYLRLAEEEEADQSTTGPLSQEWMDRLRAEQDNLRAALEWGQSQEIGLRLVSALWHFWELSGEAAEGRHWLANALSRAEGADKKVRARALYGAGVLAWIQGDYIAARALYEESLGVSRELGHKGGIAASLNSLGLLAKDQCAYASVNSLYAECLEIYRELGNSNGIAASLTNLGLVAKDQGDYASARALTEESLGIYREVGNRIGIATSLNNLGLVTFHQGDYVSARALLEESLGIYRELGNRIGIAASLNNLGLVTFHQSDYASAQALYVESLGIFRELVARRYIAISFERLASLVLKKESAERAARLWGAASTLRAAMGFRLPLRDREQQEYEVAAAKEALGEDAFTVALAEGRAMPLEQAMAYALEEPEE
jgi:predicted ATPase/DNA-binding SARP family transcriptional activator